MLFVLHTSDPIKAAQFDCKLIRKWQSGNRNSWKSLFFETVAVKKMYFAWCLSAWYLKWYPLTIKYNLLFNN